MDGDYYISYNDNEGGYAIMISDENIIKIIAMHLYLYPTINIDIVD